LEVDFVAPGVSPSVFPALRACSVSGDISRDLVKGKGGGWAVVGVTISEVHKLESLAKRYRTGIYFELDSSAFETSLSFQVTNDVPWLEGPRMRFVEFRTLPLKLVA